VESVKIGGEFRLAVEQQIDGAAKKCRLLEDCPPSRVS
jgi:hypothetical protein